MWSFRFSIASCCGLRFDSRITKLTLYHPGLLCNVLIVRCIALTQLTPCEVLTMTKHLKKKIFKYYETRTCFWGKHRKCYMLNVVVKLLLWRSRTGSVCATESRWSSENKSWVGKSLIPRIYTGIFRRSAGPFPRLLLHNMGPTNVIHKFSAEAGKYMQLFRR